MNKIAFDGVTSPIYENDRGWRYSVSEGIGYNDDYDKVVVYAVKYHKPGKCDLYSARDKKQPRYTRAEAEKDLVEYATSHNLKLVKEWSE